MTHSSAIRIDLEEEQGWLRRLARSLTADEASADDLVQDASLKLLAEPGPHDRRSLVRAVLRAFRGDRRARARRRRREAVHAAESSREECSTDRLQERSEIHELLLTEVLNLKEAHRSVLLLRYFEGLSLAAIAREAGVAEGTVRARLTRAREELRERLDRRFGGDREGWLPSVAALALGRASRAAIHGTVIGAGGALVMNWKGLMLALCAVVALFAWISTDEEGLARAQDPKAQLTADAAALEALPGPVQLALPPPAELADDREPASKVDRPANAVRRRIPEVATLELTGRVVERGPDGVSRPYPGAEIRVLREDDILGGAAGAPRPEERLTSRSDGTFSLDAGALEAVYLEVTAPGFARTVVGSSSFSPEEMVRVEAGPFDAFGDVVLAPPQTFSGVVVDEGGLPVVGAELRAHDASGGWGLTTDNWIFARVRTPDATTDDAGRFVVQERMGDPGAYFVSHPDYESRIVSHPGVGGVARIVLRRGAVIRGRLEAPRDERAPAHVLAWHPYRRSYEDVLAGAAPIQPDGSFEITGLMKGEPYELKAFSRLSPSNCSEPLTYRTGARGGDEDVVLSAVAGATVKFTVLDRTGQPAQGLSVWSTTTGDNFRELTLFRTPLHTEPWVDGQVLLERIVPSFPDDPLEVTVSTADHDLEFLVEELAPGEVRDLGTVRLGAVESPEAPKGELEVTLVTEEGRPVGQYPLSLTLEEEDPERRAKAQSARTDARGQSRFEDLQPGRYLVRVEPDPRRVRPRSGAPEPSPRCPSAIVEVTSGDEPASVTLTVPKFEVIRGVVTHEGRPVEGARIVLLDPRDNRAMRKYAFKRASSLKFPATTEADGSFTIEGVTAGRWAVAAYGADRLRGASEVDVQEGGAEVRIELASRRLVGRVVAPDGRPVANAGVVATAWGPGHQVSEQSLREVERTEGYHEAIRGSGRCFTADDGTFDLPAPALLEFVSLIIYTEAHPARSVPIELGSDSADPEELVDLGTIQLEAGGALEIDFRERPEIDRVLLRSTSGRLDLEGEPLVILREVHRLLDTWDRLPAGAYAVHRYDPWTGQATEALGSTAIQVGRTSLFTAARSTLQVPGVAGRGR